jgi:hypothetical protein
MGHRPLDTRRSRRVNDERNEMLTTARQASNYRSVASAVNTRLADLRLNGVPTRNPDKLTQDRIDTICDLLAVGRQYARGPGELATYSSSPAKLDLAQELVKYVPRKLPPYDQQFDMREWTSQAVRVLKVLRDGGTWSELADDADFATTELQPFLRRLLSLPPEEPDW